MYFVRVFGGARVYMCDKNREKERKREMRTRESQRAREEDRGGGGEREERERVCVCVCAYGRTCVYARLRDSMCVRERACA